MKQEQWLQRHPAAGSSLPSWPKASQNANPGFLGSSTSESKPQPLDHLAGIGDHGTRFKLDSHQVIDSGLGHRRYPQLLNQGLSLKGIRLHLLSPRYREQAHASRDNTLAGPLWEGCREGRRYSRDTYLESYITKYTSIQR